jgi:hypothetical protein
MKLLHYVDHGLAVCRTGDIGEMELDGTLRIIDRQELFLVYCIIFLSLNKQCCGSVFTFIRMRLQMDPDPEIQSLLGIRILKDHPKLLVRWRSEINVSDPDLK